ncbi:MAG TPA: ATPase [Anaerolineaceae bacterium]|nr:ATPase [Anaerolineaceae bacterium]
MWKKLDKLVHNRLILDRFWEIAGAVSIRTKILGLALGLVLLVGIGNTLQTRMVLTRNMEAQLRDQSVSVARDLAARAVDPILLNDLLALQDLLLETKGNNTNFRYAFIVDQRGQVMAHTFGEGFPVGLLDLNHNGNLDHHHTVLIDTDEGLIFDTAVSILDGKAGTARIGLSNVSVQQAVSQVTLQSVLFTVLVLLFGVVVAMFLTRILAQPILELVEATRMVSRGDYTHRVHPWANDELGTLAQAFNQMSQDLAQIHELRQEREGLQRQLLEKVISTQEEERRRIARELHDSTSQSLTSLLVGLRMLETNCKDPDQQQISDLRSVATQTLDEVHKLATQLRPHALDDLGLSAALERLTFEWQARHKVPIDLAITLKDSRLPEGVETALYRIIQETLTNVVRHAHAHSVSILVERRDGSVITVIEDDGKGFEVCNSQGEYHLGLLGMRERAELLGGHLTIESNPGHGTSVFVEIPLFTEDNLDGQKETHLTGG